MKSLFMALSKVKTTTYFFILFTSLFHYNTYSQKIDDLKRQADWGFRLNAPTDGKKGGIVRRVIEGSQAEKAGLQVKDKVVLINNNAIENETQLDKLLRQYKSGDKASLLVLRNNKPIEINYILPPTPKESYPNIDVLYHSLITDEGYKVRRIITKPSQSKGKLPVIYLTQWLSCGGTEIHSNPQKRGGVSALMADIIEKSGCVFVRTERPGDGDSEGVDCTECDFLTELETHKLSIQQLSQYDFIDTTQIYLFGSSMGASIAPLLASEMNIKGMILTGGFAKTWFEHMIELERRRLALDGKSDSEATENINALIQIYTGYYLEKKTPKEVLREKPHLAKFWYLESEHQYGRPASFYHQVQDINFLKIWEKINIPTLILHGEYDWIMSESDQYMIEKIVNKKHPKLLELKVIPKMDHSLFIHTSLQESYNNYWGGKYDTQISELSLNWLKDKLKKEGK
jgi:pimeloyl-ACP methyl ester carboxylesterase